MNFIITFSYVYTMYFGHSHLLPMALKVVESMRWPQGRSLGSVREPGQSPEELPHQDQERAEHLGEQE
jgi:hypothetical protein